jgi:hypothetical protein
LARNAKPEITEIRIAQNSGESDQIAHEWSLMQKGPKADFFTVQKVEENPVTSLTYT